MSCSTSRQAIQERLDGPIAAERQQVLQGHLEQCAACRTYERQLQATRDALRSLPRLEFPDEALDQVWDRTVRARPWSGLTGWSFDWRAAAAAAVVVAALAGFVVVDRLQREATTPQVATVTEDYDAEEVAEAAEQARMVLELTANALRRSRSALEQVLDDEVSPALDRLPLRWPEKATAERRSSGA